MENHSHETRDGDHGNERIVMTPEEVIEQTGGCGRYQILLTTTVHSMKVIVCFTMLHLVFSAKAPDWWCIQDINVNAGNSSDPASVSLNQLNLTERYKKCEIGNGTQCTAFMFDTKMKTLVTEWDLVCDKAWVTSTMASVQMFGVLAGNALCGQLADTIGRKKPLFMALAILFVFNLVSMFSVSWTMFTVCRFFLGLGNGFFITVQYSIMSEFALAKWRPAIVALPSWPIEACFFALVVWLLKDWKYLQLVTALLCVPFFATWWFIPESFRYFVAHDRHEDVKSVVRVIAKVNKRQAPDFTEMKSFTTSGPAKSGDNQTDKDRKYSAVDLFKTRRLLRISLLLVTNWFALGLIYYGITFGIKNLSGSIFLNIFLFNSIGIPLKFAVMFLPNKIGRRITCILMFSLTFAVYCTAGIFQYIDISVRDKVIVGLAILGATFIGTAWSPVQTITIEVYPTVVRNIGYGFCNTMARIGAVIGPQIVFLDDLVPGILYFICGGISLMVVVSTLLLPETKGLALQDKIEVSVTAEKNNMKRHNQA